MSTGDNNGKLKLYECLCCAYSSKRRYNYMKHMTTESHMYMMSHYKSNKENFKNVCSCGKSYKFQSGLYRHKQKCIKLKNIENELIDNNKKNDLILNLIKENQELKTQMLEVSKQCLTTNTTTINNTNSNNNSNNNNTTFNLQFFLNETCKDAMSIQDFVHSIRVTIEDLKRIGNAGYVEGVSALIIDHLKDLDITKRPLHCSDVKRETMYIKDNDVWAKDNEHKEKLKSVLNEINKRNVKAIQQYQNQYPDYNAHNSKVSHEYNEIVFECFGGKNDNMDESKQKVIGRIAPIVKVN